MGRMTHCHVRVLKFNDSANKTIGTAILPQLVSPRLVVREPSNWVTTEWKDKYETL